MNAITFSYIHSDTQPVRNMWLISQQRTADCVDHTMKNKKTENIALGAGLGIVFGAVFGSVAIGLVIGAALGTVAGPKIRKMIKPASGL